MKIVCFGDSLTWVGYGGSYFQELVKLMPEHELINAGVGGNTVVNLLRRVEDDVIAHQPDGVFIMVGGNDAISYSQPKTRSYYRQGQDIPEGVVTPEMFETAYRDLITILHAQHILVWMGLEPNEYNPTTAAALTEYNAIAQSVAETFSVPVLDLMEHYPPGDLPDRPELDIGFIITIGAREKRGFTEYEDTQKKGGFRYTFDGLHLTPQTAREVAELVAAFLRENGA